MAQQKDFNADAWYIRENGADDFTRPLVEGGRQFIVVNTRDSIGALGEVLAIIPVAEYSSYDAEAVANLIVASPALLAACVELSLYTHEGECTIPRYAMKKFEAAVAKAKTEG